MSNADETSAGDGVWAGARVSYEDPAQNIDALAQSLGLTRFQLVREAKLRGWMLRTQSKTADTRATLTRFRTLLQKRLADLEAEIGAMSADAKSKRDISDINLLVRTLEKVLQLERRERDTRLKRRRQRIRFNDAERAELTRRIEALCREEKSSGLRGDADGAGEGAAREGLGALDEGQPASAGGS